MNSILNIFNILKPYTFWRITNIISHKYIIQCLEYSELVSTECRIGDVGQVNMNIACVHIIKPYISLLIVSEKSDTNDACEM